MSYETKGWNIGDPVYYFDIRNARKNDVSLIWFRRSNVSGLDRHNISTDDGSWLLPGQAYKTLDELKTAVLQQIEEEYCWHRSAEVTKRTV